MSLRYRIVLEDPTKTAGEKVIQFFSSSGNVEEEVLMRMAQEKMSPSAVAYVWETKEVLSKTIVNQKRLA